MRHYCTMFDSAYLAKGLAMIGSLLKHSSQGVQIHVLALDEACRETLFSLELESVMIWPFSIVDEVTGLSELKKTRTHQEWCWSCGSIFTDYMWAHVNDELTYIDADCFFFSDPEIVFDEIGEKSIAITPHRFAKKDEARLLPNGKYAVQWVTFRGDVGRKCLSKWAQQCREWCFYRHEDGKFADQKYLDTWMRDYPGEVCEIENPGVGLAPWNIANYSVGKAGDTVMVDAHRLIMFHAHEYLHGQRLTNWPLRPEDKELIYGPYAAAIEAATRFSSSQAIILK
jgi:hypothetical protein